ncbi:hypothetical protein GLOIN_2v1877169 [Rhizophagus irregularis DAOM 181602=DAOM 197198]|uniref:TLDc domain-containing protein n=1 Tax=Rhizophagus irregularis (strain DAOM 181602 / DAOM 197198 / MUCL 43194) TaxID=747089 RepID=A0A2P4PWZ5_RHIID|nr:hypothetical protein GLOIN_2v1877169 [Rhizophagus irregularis DAOM 181602=DAOM 197198]POG69913.1 hypothetical protein GLOIN_2v1877169 [Rhizophagus irregularis DAOM 181602=DAOM 197198]|eukprot:XP_025176779.1 hypothetical protein GLOIN_2v1877169 [Rhizophagus irregularis DAOM 181602=DAOM 197198]
MSTFRLLTKLKKNVIAVFTRLSENYIEILNDDEYYDITIEVGKDPNNNDGILAHIKLSDISPEIFQIILKYIYGGIIFFNEQETLEILKVLIAADKLHLQELVDYLQKYLIENKVELMKQNFGLVYQTSFKSDSLLDLQQFCIDYPDTWTDDDYEMMKNTLQPCLPLIRFFSLSSEEFAQKVRPYKKLLGRQLYENLLNSYLDPNIEPSDNILLPRYKNVDGVIDSKIVNLNIVSLVSRWVDKIDIKSKFAYTRELYLSYKFNLLLRGSQDGFTPKRFHELCDNISHTITFIKVRGTEEIIGGYNPLIWKSLNNEYGETKDSFIFSFKSKDNFKVPILSHVNPKDINGALFYHTRSGPTFGRDLYIGVKGVDSDEYHRNYCRKYRYEKEIRNTEDLFSIEDYEVFQIVKS